MIQALDNLDSTTALLPDVPAHLERALGERWRRYRKAFARCRRKFSEESVHQLRVETRRLLALLNLLEEWGPAEELDLLRRLVKKFFNRFARLRDTQVQLGLVQKLLPRFPAAAPFAEALAQHEKRLIKKAVRKLRQLSHKEAKPLVARLNRTLDSLLEQGGLRAHGQEILSQHVSSLFLRVTALRRRIDPARPITIHRTRIAFKKFRYLVELARPLLPGGITTRQLTAMHSYQTLMGRVQDLEVLQATLEKFMKKEPERAPLLKPFQCEIERQRERSAQRYLARADDLARFWPAGGPEGTKAAPRNRVDRPPSPNARRVCS